MPKRNMKYKYDAYAIVCISLTFVCLTMYVHINVDVKSCNVWLIIMSNKYIFPRIGHNCIYVNSWLQTNSTSNTTVQENPISKN